MAAQLEGPRLPQNSASGPGASLGSSPVLSGSVLNDAFRDVVEGMEGAQSTLAKQNRPSDLGELSPSALPLLMRALDQGNTLSSTGAPNSAQTEKQQHGAPPPPSIATLAVAGAVAAAALQVTKEPSEEEKRLKKQDEQQKEHQKLEARNELARKQAEIQRLASKFSPPPSPSVQGPENVRSETDLRAQLDSLQKKVDQLTREAQAA